MFEFDWVQHIRMAFAKSKAKLQFLSLHGVEYNIKSISPVRENIGLLKKRHVLFHDIMGSDSPFSWEVCVIEFIGW